MKKMNRNFSPPSPPLQRTGQPHRGVFGRFSTSAISSLFPSALFTLHSALFTFLALFLFSCESTPPTPIPNNECETGEFPAPVTGSEASSRLWIANEGTFQWGNASLGWYDPATSSYQAEVFDSVNQQPLGDVFQSITFEGERAFLVVNNSGKVEVVNQQSGMREGTISGLVSPRYFLPVSSNKAYVSDLYANAIAVVNPNSFQVTGNIPLNGWTEQMLVVDSLAFVTNLRTEYVYLISVERDEVIDSIEVGLGSSRIAQDAEGKLWVGCDGDPLSGIPGRISVVDPQSRQVIRSYDFPANERPSRLQMGPDGAYVYFLNDGCFVMPIDRDSLPACPIIPSDGGLLYGLGIDPGNGDIYVSDAIDYVQRGVVLRYDKSGTFIGEFLAGIIPGAMAFDE